MSRRYLFGPIPPRFAEQCLHRPRTAGACLAFDSRAGADLVVGPEDTWDGVQARFPAGWRPDFVVLHLPYTTVPHGLWTAPVPIVGLATDWDLLWHRYRGLQRCDLLLTDAVGVEKLHAAGLSQARPANLCGCPREYLEGPSPQGQRDIDVLLIGNVNPAVQRGRLPWLARLARLGRRWRVLVHSGVPDVAYRELLGRARIVFNRSRTGACNRRAFEAAASGALLFQEADNRELPAYLRDRQECIYYRPDNLEALLARLQCH